MKRFLKIAAVIFAVILLFLPATVVMADVGEGYTVKEDGEELVLSKDGAEAFRASTLGEIFEFAADASAEIYFDNVTSDGGAILRSGSFRISGELYLGADLVIDGADVYAEGLSLSLSGGASVKLKTGSFYLLSSKLVSDSSAVRMEYSSSARLSISGSEIVGNSKDGAIFAKLGTLYAVGGKIENSGGPAIKAGTSISLAGDIALVSEEYGIETSVPISLTVNGKMLESKIKVKYEKSFAEGTMTPVLYKTSERVLSLVEMYDASDKAQTPKFFKISERTEEENFAAVYLPFTVEFYSGKELYATSECLLSERVSEPLAPSISGYKFLGWSTDASGTSMYEFQSPVSGSIKLYAIHSLLPPSFSISSLSFTYDKSFRYLTFDSMDHPLMGEGVLNYTWFKDSTRLAESAEKINISKVTDSGNYQCKLEFTHNGNFVSVMTPVISVSVSPAQVEVPQVSEKYYTGAPQYPDIEERAEYSVLLPSGTDVGVYPVKISLRDPENYVFFGYASSEISVPFRILRAENSFSAELCISDYYEGGSPSPLAISKFGTVTYLYSDSENGTFSESVPTKPGVYYAIAKVSGTENYSELISDPVRFSVFAEEVVGISLKSPPSKLSYLAFDIFSKDGVSVLASYNSGRAAEVPLDQIAVEYQSGECFLFGDSSVFLSYSGKKLAIAVTVAKAKYDISGIVFSDAELTYSGNAQSLSYWGELPTGKDGIPLLASVVGGGTDSGIYEISLVFSSESRNYELPQPLLARLSILPLSVSLSWKGADFIYDGELKAPSAEYTDVLGKVRAAEILGAASFAGDYLAKAVPNDQNYVFSNPELPFTVHKAEYDTSGAFWSSSEFIYNGEAHSVFLLGLPEGVSVIGYIDNSASDAGNYTAKAELDFDSLNYLYPKIPDCDWTVLPAEYDLSGFSFENTVAVFNGSPHYPKPSGELPRGFDGSQPTYSFDRGATHVAEGEVWVTVTFRSGSKNYLAPEEQRYTVRVIPLEIDVIWSGLEFTYSGAEYLPTASSAFAEIRVSGAAKNAGEYKAFAESMNSDYRVRNAEMTFTVNKAENGWERELSVSDIYEGDALTPDAVSKGGDVVFRYFSDAELQNEVEPILPGVYYAIAECRGFGNYKHIVSEPVRFSIIKLLPLELIVEIKDGGLRAFDKLGEGDFSVLVLYNSGRCEAIDFSEISVSYQSADSLRASDEYISFSAMGLRKLAAVSVEKAVFDLSGVFWSGSEFVYSGEPVSIYLEGLPSGLEVSYSGNGAKDAGEYEVVPSFEYDSENYLPPNIGCGRIIIQKFAVKTPECESLIYNGKDQSPNIESSDLYNYTKKTYRDGGVYSVRLSLNDPKNYVFSESGTSELNVEFEILPLAITLTIGEALFSEGEALGNVPYTVSEQIPEGDDLLLEFYAEGGKVYCRSKNPNYKISVIPGEIVEKPLFGEEMRHSLFIIFLMLLVLILALVAAIMQRERIGAVLLPKENSEQTAPNGAPPEIVALKPEPAIPEKPSEPETQAESAEALSDELAAQSAIDASHANSLISDELARTLIRKEPRPKTEGRRKGIINIDTLSKSFKAGDTVDINRMKSGNLIPYDTGYIKVLARGVIDKPLRIYANDFSLSAVKMIALTGGEAIRVSGTKKRVTHEEEKN